jgi:succinoglycan biosynthesis transport protein ExoP
MPLSPPIDSRLTPAPQGRDRMDFIDIERLLRMALRQAKVVGVCAVIGLLFGVLYLQTTPRIYTSIARVLIDEGLTRMVDDSMPASSSSQAEAMVLSQIEILRSARLAAVVVDKLDLSRNENFMRPPTSLFGKVFGYARWAVSLVTSFIPSSAPDMAAAQPMDETTRQAIMTSLRREGAILMLQGNVLAQRVGRSLVIAIGFQSHDRELATAITRAYSDAYRADQLNASFDATEQAAVWMEGRLTELRESSQAASLAVEKYRADKGLTTAKGTLITDQQLSELTAQLITAQSESARWLARYQQFAALSEGNLADSINAITLPSEESATTAITDLRARYQNVVRRQQEIEKNYGTDHPQAAALQREADKLLEQLSQELGQLAEGYRSEYEVAKAREATLKQAVESANGNSAAANESLVRLRELEQQATALSALYQSYLERYERATQQQSFPIAKVRIISEAMRPMGASEPRTIVVMAMSLVLGLMMGGVLGGINEFNERFFRTGEDVTDRLGVKFLGYLPVVGRSDKGKQREAANDAAPKPDASLESDKRAKMRVTVTAPSSMFAESLRSAKIAADVVLQGRPCKVIGIVSALPGEGKSTVAANFAELLAGTGARTLVIDGDLRNPGLTRNFGVSSTVGLVDAVVDLGGWRAMLKYDRQTNLAIMPGLVRGGLAHTAEALSSPGMRQLMEDARKQFDYIVVDLPPLGPVVDAKAFAPLADGFIAVVEWGRTPRALVNDLLNSDPVIVGKMLGVVLNKVKLGELAKFGGFGGSEQFLTQYSSYYLDEVEDLGRKPDDRARKEPTSVVTRLAAARANQQSAQR